MPTVLTMQSIILCGPVEASHGGKVAPMGNTKLQVGGKTVLLESSIILTPPTVNISGCQVQKLSSTNILCTMVTSISSGKATKLTVGGKLVDGKLIGGKPVLLVSLSGQTNGTPVGSLVATETQTKLTAV